MIIQTFDRGLKAWVTPANDDRILIEMDDGCTFTIREEDGAITLQSNDGELILHPMSRTQVGIENPTT